VVGRRGENFGVEKRWKKNKNAGREDGIFVHPENGLNGLIHNWCIGGCWFTPAVQLEIETLSMDFLWFWFWIVLLKTVL
jgi:hypothetical protein